MGIMHSRSVLLFLRRTLLALVLLTLSGCGSPDSPNRTSEEQNPADNVPDNDRTLGIWPINGSTTPDCIQDGFGHRVLGESDDFHPGLDTCDDNPKDLNDEANPNDEETGFNILAPLSGVVSRVRKWDTAWDDNPELCNEFCRQGNYVMIEHPDLEEKFGGVVQTIYMHMAQDSIPESIMEGQAINQGEKIGVVGKTGNDINTMHLHMGLLVGSVSGKIDFDNYINPLHILPYPAATTLHPVTLSRGTSTATMFDTDECAAIDDPDIEFDTLNLQLTQTSPALDTTRIEVKPHDTAMEAMVLDVDKRIGIGNDTNGTTADDFQQGCVAVEADDFNEDEQNYLLTIHFGGDWDEFTLFDVTLTDVRGETRTEILDTAVD